MKRLIAAAALTIFIGAVNADDVYQGGWADGNPDLYPHDLQRDEMAGAQPGVGSGVDIYGDFKTGNPDLFSGSSERGGSGGDHDIYRGFGDGNPDL
ncbi:MAG: hypothetical protein ABFS23_09455 [Pseudomonadota bacterium]